MVKVVVGRFLRGHSRRLGLQYQPDGFSRCPVIDVEGLLPGHMKQQVSLADAAPQHDLNRIHTTGVVLADADDGFVVAEFDIQQIHGQ